MTTENEHTAGDAAALVRACLREDAMAYELLSADPGLLHLAFGQAVALAAQAAGGPEALDAALQRLIEAHRE